MLYLLLIALTPIAVGYTLAIAASTRRHMRHGNTHARTPFAFRYALPCAIVETLAHGGPIAQHRLRLRRVREAETRRAVAIANAMQRHPAGRHLIATSAQDETNPDTADDDFTARARAIHAADQIAASMAEAVRLHPVTRNAIARAKAVHPAATSAATGAAARAAG